MSRDVYNDTIISVDTGTGAPTVLTAGVFVHVTLTSDSTDATLFVDRTGGVEIANPFEAIDGVVRFWCDQGEYDVAYHDSLSRIADTTIGWEAIPGADGGLDGRILQDASIPGSKLEDQAITSSKLADDAVPIAVGSFSAASSASYTIPASGTGTVIVWDTERWDYSNSYDHTTGRFTPSVAGVYRLSTFVHPLNLDAGEEFLLRIRKNGSNSDPGTRFVGIQEYSTTGYDIAFSVSALFEANGSSDYFEVLVVHTHSTSVYVDAQFFDGELIGRIPA